jgi:hypothetical protein
VRGGGNPGGEGRRKGRGEGTRRRGEEEAGESGEGEKDATSHACACVAVPHTQAPQLRGDPQQRHRQGACTCRKHSPYTRLARCVCGVWAEGRAQGLAPVVSSPHANPSLPSTGLLLSLQPLAGQVRRRRSHPPPTQGAWLGRGDPEEGRDEGKGCSLCSGCAREGAKGQGQPLDKRRAGATAAGRSAGFRCTA